MSTITINGNTLEPVVTERPGVRTPRVLAEDASKSNYILIQTRGGPLSKTQKQELKNKNVDIQEYVGNATYLCGFKPDNLQPIRLLSFVRYADVYQQTFVVQPEARYPSSAGIKSEKEEKEEKVDVILHHDVEISDNLIRQIAIAAHVPRESISHLAGKTGKVRLKVSEEYLDDLAAIDEVRFIKKVYRAKLYNNIARRIINAENVVVNNTSYKGEGQIVAVADTGFDKGDPLDVHPAFEGRIIKLYALGRPNQSDDLDGHGTHVCGSVLGSGQSIADGKIEGVAPGADLIVQSTFSRFESDANGRDHARLDGIPDDLQELFLPPYDDGARIHTNSWGTGPHQGSPETQLPYTSDSEEIDRFIWGHQDMTILFAAGNDGIDRNSDGAVDIRSIGAEAASKNCITVGATENDRPRIKYRGQSPQFSYTYGDFWPAAFPADPVANDHMANNPDGLAAFSSRGPTKEGRRKPDVVAPGTAILSTRSRNMPDSRAPYYYGLSADTRYMYSAGTGMACPLVAGCCAVLRETLVDNGYADEVNGVINPTCALIKALLINGAYPITGQYMPTEVISLPNNHSGFGRVNLAGSVILPNQGAPAGFHVGIMDDDPIKLPIPIPKKEPTVHLQDGEAPQPAAPTTPLTLKVTLAYSDAPGAALQNDLNLIVVTGNKERHGNQGAHEYNVDSTNGFDRVNNIEQVIWEGITGDEAVIVIKGYRLTTDQQPFAYVWRFY